MFIGYQCDKEEVDLSNLETRDCYLMSKWKWQVEYIARLRGGCLIN